MNEMSKLSNLIPNKFYFNTFYPKLKIGGFFALPLLWLVNVIWFFQQAFMRAWFKEQKQIRYYVGGSMIGFLVYMVPMLVWAVYFQTNRLQLGEWGQSITFITPAGRP